MTDTDDSQDGTPRDDGPELTVVADMAQCDGYGECVKVAPRTFGLDEDGFVDVLQPTISSADSGPAIAAVNKCPKGALSLHLDGRPVDLYGEQ